MIIRNLLIMMTFLAFGSSLRAEESYPTNLSLVGQSSLSFFWWDIYDAELYNQSGQYQQDQWPLLLKLTYQRSIKSVDLLEETDSQWQRFNISQEQRQFWLSQLAKIWPDVHKDDSIAFYVDNSGNCHFYFNQSFIGSVNDAEFSVHFANIWLAKDGPFPKMTRKLTGG